MICEACDKKSEESGTMWVMDKIVLCFNCMEIYEKENEKLSVTTYECPMLGTVTVHPKSEREAISDDVYLCKDDNNETLFENIQNIIVIVNET